MRKYIGTKTINAKPMNRLDYNNFRGWTLPADENGLDEGYLVEYVDGGQPNTAEYQGYVSWSPKEQFDNAYRLNGELTFGDAIVYLKQGHKLARSGWNGKGMFIYYVEANKYPATGNKLGTMIGVFEDDLVPYQAYIAMKTADNTVVPWLCSQSDMLADDWEVVGKISKKVITPPEPPITRLELTQRQDLTGYSMLLVASLQTADGVRETLSYRMEKSLSNLDILYDITRQFNGKPVSQLKKYLSTLGEEV